MGISGLLPLLKSIHKTCSLKEFSGQTIGVDAYGWLHRGTAACAIELATGKPTTKFVEFAMHRVRMLVHFGITPYLVFDGDNLPSKAGTEQERRARRSEGKRLGMELLSIGKTAQAHQELQKSVDVTPEMARMLIEELKHHNIPYVVAPYEADSQLVYLERIGVIHGILSEDSDLLVFGAKCLLTKLDKYGECVEINRTRFTACKEVSFVGWSDADFRRMAILSGCDYLPGIGGLGLKTAHRMLRKYKTVERLVKAAHFDGKLKVPANFMTSFEQAEKTFLYQWVYCPIAAELVHLTPLEPGLSIIGMPYIGEKVAANIAMRVAKGDLYPRTKTPLSIPVVPKPSGKPLLSTRLCPEVQTPNPKSSKPIDIFFKPKRTPLAELNPNSFTPSASQQNLLERQRMRNSWVAVPAPRRTPQIQPSPARTAPPAARRTVTDPLAGRQSVPNLIRQQRLCSEMLYNDLAKLDTNSVTSHHFASTAPELSPSLRQSNKRKRETLQDPQESSTNASRGSAGQTPESRSSALQARKKKLYGLSGDERPTLLDKSQSMTKLRASIGQSQDTVGNFPSSTIHSSPKLETIFSTAISSQMQHLRSTFTYQSLTSTPSRKQHSTESAFDRERTYASTPTTLPPLSGSEATIVQSLEGVHPTSPIREDGVTDASQNFVAPEVEVEAVVVAASSPPPSAATREREAPLKGSEDLLVPDSEVESDCSPRKPMFSLARFAYSGVVQ